MPADVYLEGSGPASRLCPLLAARKLRTRGRAPYDTVVTHGFTMDEEGRKMSKSFVATPSCRRTSSSSPAPNPAPVVVTTDYWEDQRLGKNVLQTNIDA